MRGRDDRTAAEPAPFEVLVALRQLAAGDYAVRLPDRALGAAHLNAVAARLAAATDAEPRGGYLFADAAELAARGEELVVAVVGVGRLGDLRRQMGPQIAREILNGLCDRIRGELQAVRIGRVGGAQIEILFPAQDLSAALATLERVRSALELPLVLDGQSFEVDVAIGVARAGVGDDEAIENAAIALARAQTGHAKIGAFTQEERREAEARVQLLRDLHEGLASGQLFLHHQPKLYARTGKIEQAEALVRWRHPEQGLIPPLRFIGLAEETGAIAELTRWVLRQAVADRIELERRGHPLCIHINLSARLLHDQAFTEWMLETVQPLEPGAIGLEVTETAIIEDPREALANLQMFADAGLPIAIDDYGSGLSSLAYLKQMPARELKIDRLFISELASNHRDPLLVRSTIDLAHALGMDVTAEGVEDLPTLALLRAMGCDMIQGYAVARPMLLADLHRLLRDGVRVEEKLGPRARRRRAVE